MNSYRIWDPKSEDEPLDIEANYMDLAIEQWFNHEQNDEIRDDMILSGFTVHVQLNENTMVFRVTPRLVLDIGVGRVV